MSLYGAGRTLGGRYNLVRELARGGMAAVWEAQDEALDRHVAIKLLHPQFADDPEFLERFRREARAAARLSHPNIVSLYDVGEDADTRTPFIVMELVDGENLKDYIQRAAPLEDAEIRSIGAALASTLDYAHRRGIIHRDVKPQNVLLGEDRRPRLTDFGIAQAVAASGLTRTGAVMGSVHYLAPELVRGRPATPQSDVYGLGAVLYEMATGRVPFEGETDLAVALAHVEETPAAPRTLNPRLAAHLERIILQALARSPEQRYSSSADLATALRGLAQASAAAPSVGLAEAATQRLSTLPASPGARPASQDAAAPGPAAAPGSAAASAAAASDDPGSATTSRSAAAPGSAAASDDPGSATTPRSAAAPSPAASDPGSAAARSAAAPSSAAASDDPGSAALGSATGGSDRARSAVARSAAAGSAAARSAASNPGAAGSASAAPGPAPPAAAAPGPAGSAAARPSAAAARLAGSAATAAARGPVARRPARRAPSRGAGGGLLALLLAMAVVLVALGAGLFGLVSLNREGAAPPAPTAALSPTPERPTAVPKPAAVPTSSPLPEATATPEPSATPAPEPSPTSAPTPSPAPPTPAPPTPSPLPPASPTPPASPRARTVAVPQLRGKTLEDAQATLKSAGLTVTIRGASANVERNVVADQSPDAGVGLPPGGTVTIQVGNGSTSIPEVANLTREQALRTLQNNSFHVTPRDRRDPRVPAGTALGTVPPAGTVLARGSDVELDISAGR